MERIAPGNQPRTDIIAHMFDFVKPCAANFAPALSRALALGLTLDGAGTMGKRRKWQSNPITQTQRAKQQQTAQPAQNQPRALFLTQRGRKSGEIEGESLPTTHTQYRSCGWQVCNHSLGRVIHTALLLTPLGVGSRAAYAPAREKSVGTSGDTSPHADAPQKERGSVAGWGIGAGRPEGATTTPGQGRLCRLA